MIIRDNFSYFSKKPYVVIPHLNSLNETVQIKGHISEASQQDGSDEGSQHMVLCKINKNYP